MVPVPTITSLPVLATVCRPVPVTLPCTLTAAEALVVEMVPVVMFRLPTIFNAADAAVKLTVLASTSTSPVTETEAAALTVSVLDADRSKLPPMATMAEAALTVNVVAVTLTSPPTTMVPVALFTINGEEASTLPVIFTGLLPQVMVPVPRFTVRFEKMVGAVKVLVGNVMLVLSVPSPKTRSDSGSIVMKPEVFTICVAVVVRVSVLKAPTSKLPEVRVNIPVKAVDPVKLISPEELISTLS